MPGPQLAGPEHLVQPHRGAEFGEVELFGHVCGQWANVRLLPAEHLLPRVARHGRAGEFTHRDLIGELGFIRLFGVGQFRVGHTRALAPHGVQLQTLLDRQRPGERWRTGRPARGGRGPPNGTRSAEEGPLLDGLVRASFSRPRRARPNWRHDVLQVRVAGVRGGEAVASLVERPPVAGWLRWRVGLRGRVGGPRLRVRHRNE